MKTITIANQQYFVPQNWGEVKIRQQKLAETLVEAQHHVKSLGIISAYTGIPIEILRHQQRDVIAGILNDLIFIDTPVDKEPIFKFTIQGEEYNISDTILKQEFQDYIAAETARLQYKDDVWTQLAYLIAIMAKKDGETLDSYDINQRAEFMMDNADVQTTSQVAAFFLQSQKTSELISLLSSPEIMQLAVTSKIQQLRNTLTVLGQQRGKNLLIRLWIFVLKIYIKFISTQWQNALNSQASNNSKKSWMQSCKDWLTKKRKRKVNK
jgi:hypothetical protein